MNTISVGTERLRELESEVQELKNLIDIKNRQIARLDADFIHIIQRGTVTIPDGFWGRACSRLIADRKKSSELIQKMMHALQRIRVCNKNDGNSPENNYGPHSMQYWRWQELISRRIAEDTLEEVLANATITKKDTP